jgi:CelD/BcsL family acetyltransferase involved in cellulose biosynthesis
VPHTFAVVEQRGAPVAIALVTRGREQRRGPLPIRTTHLGTAGERHGESVVVEYNRLLTLPQHRAAAFEALTRAIGRAPWRTDLIELNGFAPEELAGWDMTGYRIDRQVCHVADLAAMRAAEGPIERAFGSSVAAKVRKNQRRFSERFGPIATEWVTEVDRAQPVFTKLIALHQARWQEAGEPGAFAGERLPRFHRALIARLLPEGKVVLVRVTAGEQLVGVFYGFAERGAIYHYQWGLTRFEESSLSPGFVTGICTMQAAIERGFSELNWLAGDVRYKRELATTSRELIWAERPVSPWMHTVYGLIALKHRLRRRRR